ncbi:Y+L amino acid transporter 2-like [Liolophura sinensis]|uniref:Y+L amino acid transporter 2-like n=1 Tax=Liolophura sinensis TaxID=3198878 RepID=UPI0031591335
MAMQDEGGEANHGFEDIDLGESPSSLDTGHPGNSSPINQTGTQVIHKCDIYTATGAVKPECEAVEKSPPINTRNETVRLDRFMSLGHFVVILVASTGGQSVFISPGPVLQYSGSVGLALIIWFAGGILNLLLALCFTELGTLFPEAGGPYVFTLRTFGSMPAFLTAWGYTILVVSPAWALLAYITALYSVQPFFSGCSPPLLGVRLLAATVLLSCVALNCIHVKIVTKVQTFLSSVKLLALLIIVVGGIYRMATGEIEKFNQSFDGTTEKPGQVALAILSSYYGYGGWQVIVNVVEESKRPERDLPRSVYISFALVITLFCLTNMAYFSILSFTEITGTDAIAVLYADRLYRPITAVISVLVVVSAIGALNALVLGHSRSLFAAGRVGHMPSFVGMVHQKYHTPWPSLFILGIMSIVMLFTGDTIVLIEYVSIGAILMALEVLVVLLYLRWKPTNRKPPYKVSLVVAVTLVFIHLAVVGLSVYQKPSEMGIALAVIFVGIPVYWFGVAWKHKPKTFQAFLDKFTRIMSSALDLTKTQ